MRYTIDITIEKPIDEVINLFDNPDNMKHWQPDLVNYEHLSGEPGQPGSKAKLTYRSGKRTFDMIETILERNLPTIFSGTYEVNNTVSEVSSEFIDLGNGSTKWVSRNHFKLSGFYKIIGWLFPGLFKKQSMKYQQLFKEFAEQTS